MSEVVFNPWSCTQATSRRESWSGLEGCSLTMTMIQAMLLNKKPYLVVAADQIAALKIHRALTYGLADGSMSCYYFPDWETLPYDRFSPHQDLISARLLALSQLLNQDQVVVVTSVSTLMHRLPPPVFLVDRVWMLRAGQSLSLQTLAQSLEKAGYRHTPKVLEHGEFAIRGGLMDVYPMGSEWPYRIDLFDDEIESMRTFDPDTQRTLSKIDSIQLFPAREFPTEEAGIRQFRQAYREAFPGPVNQSAMYEAVSEGRYLNGVEYYLPLFFEHTALITDYLPQNTWVMEVGPVFQEAERFYTEVTARYESFRYDVSWPLLPPERLFVNAQELKDRLSGYPVLELSPQFSSQSSAIQDLLAVAAIPAVHIQRQLARPFTLLQAYLDTLDSDFKVVFVVESAGRREVLLQLLAQAQIFPQSIHDWQDAWSCSSSLMILIAPFDAGAIWKNLNIVWLTEAELFGQALVPQRQTKQRVVDPDLLIRDCVELKLQTPVVHIDHGVGLYMGLITLETQGLAQEFMELHYARGDKIYVPVTSMHLVSRYSGVEGDSVKLHQLGTDTWQKEAKKATEKIYDVAVELLDIYAHRQVKSSLAFEIDQEDYQRFVGEFPFEETQDQKKAIDDIEQDLTSSTPMDRLICGDVGFGKTEVAMRAAFMAVQNGKQVCVLVPTTLLASQHEENFRDRFASFPVRIGLISRFRTAKETKKLMQELEAGTLDIVIGTHKLLMSDLKFKDLGLMIIDEEHRFGVKQKEILKSFKHEVHCLAMTATPIPRTLNMALTGMRDISLIATPPAKRLSIKTFWREKTNQLIREAVLREILRGGQVFYLHNDVDTMPQVAESLQQLLPEAQVRYAHGQMRERMLEHLMGDFYHQRFNVLVCSTIIETGIDIPTANTIIMDRADLLGLAQLHQLRGRVGRSHHQAYAYLLTPPEANLSKDAVKRLEAIVALEDLGAGFLLASQDLEIRGAGELLGQEQSGHMYKIGFSLYMQLLEQAVEDLKAGRVMSGFAALSAHVEVEVYFSTLLPDDYVADVNERYVLYQRLAHVSNEEQMHVLHVELIDRFGLLPVEAQYLLRVTLLKLKAKSLGIERIQLGKAEGKFYLTDHAQLNPQVIIELIQTQSDRYRLQGPRLLVVKYGLNEDPLNLLNQIDGLLNQLSVN